MLYFIMTYVNLQALILIIHEHSDPKTIPNIVNSFYKSLKEV